MNRFVEQIIQHLLNHYKAEIIESVREKLSEVVDEFQERAEKTPNPIDDFVLELIDKLIDLGD